MAPVSPWAPIATAPVVTVVACGVVVGTIVVVGAVLVVSGMVDAVVVVVVVDGEPASSWVGWLLHCTSGTMSATRTAALAADRLARL